MITVQYLYKTLEEFEEKIKLIDKNKTCLVQIFTCALEPNKAVALAQQIQEQLPKAQIIGTSANGIIYQREQYDNETLIVIEQYSKATIGTRLLKLDNLTYGDIAKKMRHSWKEQGTPKLLKLFIGAYYDYAHQLLEELNRKNVGMKIAGGMSGEIYKSTTVPFVFDAKESYDNGMVFAYIDGRNLSIYSRINTSHEPISSTYTITKASGRTICEIENEPAKEWLAKYLGFSAEKQYDDWEDIAQNDPFVHFQLALESHKSAIRYIRYNEETDEITQYFSRLKAGDQFRISYVSPTKCVEEGRETCKEVSETPIEHLFCYSCLFRKLYMKNCAKWELEPYQETPVSGVFLLGEFGYNDGKNTLLNGSCVLSGIAERMHFMNVDKEQLERLHSIEEDNADLLEFALARQAEKLSSENEELIGQMISSEKMNQLDLYLDPYLNMPNMHKYEFDRKKIEFDKLCLLKVVNTEMLMSYMGQVGYYYQLRTLIEKLQEVDIADELGMKLHVYNLHADTFVIASNSEVELNVFVECMELIEQCCNEISREFIETPFLIRMVIVENHEHLLEQAYSRLQLYGDSQSKLILDLDSEVSASYTKEELEMIIVIQNALTENKVVPYYQGLYNNDTKEIDKYEALMRVYDKDGNVLTPFYFMDIAKKYRLYLELNQKMFELVLDDFSKLDCEVNINLSAHDIISSQFRKVMHKRLQSFPNPSNITFEIVEDEPFKNMETLHEFIAEVRAYGAKIAIDDFGAGYSNLLEIMKIRPDYLKIDGQIIRDIHKNYENEVIVDVTTTLGNKLAIDLVAEFVENEEIQEMVEKYGIRRSQGFHFSKPQPFEKIYEYEMNKKK